MKNVAIIPAGGSGKRMDSRFPKQYLPVDDIPLLVHTLRIFQLSLLIDDILLVVPKEDIQKVGSSIIERYSLSKVRQILAGGNKRQDSVKNGLDVIGDDCDIVLIHDGVRPFISGELIRLAVQEAAKHGAVAVGVPVKDTVKRVDQDGWILETLNRQMLWLTQTPQAFKRLIIQEAYQKAYQDHFYGTDDASLVERMGHPVRMIPATYENIKITTPEDILLAELLMKTRKVTVP